ncbi:MAG: formate dehydrogenase accessory sulfurtransferase FdhD [Chitinophagia bacterium]|nr:formate dehydrogenase accessory sulfurtransferase FdhD [Chitinophagia bacterium]
MPTTPIIRYASGQVSYPQDILTEEEPLEIGLTVYTDTGERATTTVSITMRTPGYDAELALGFLYTEGILSANKGDVSYQLSNNKVIVSLPATMPVDLARLQRNFYTTSSCGVCGKASIEAVRMVCPPAHTYPYDEVRLPASLLLTLNEMVVKAQAQFLQTGGIHASALFTIEGKLLNIYEDVGRHNALDKLIGSCWLNGLLTLQSHILFLSGRISFELMQKAVMVGIKVVVAVGAPSTMAVAIAEEYGITLIGFLRENRFNIYAGAERIMM